MGYGHHGITECGPGHRDWNRDARRPQAGRPDPLTVLSTAAKSSFNDSDDPIRVLSKMMPLRRQIPDDRDSDPIGPARD